MREFKRGPRANAKISKYIWIGGIVLVLFSYILLKAMEDTWLDVLLLMLGIVLWLLALGHGFATVRCPHCESSLMGRGLMGTYCPHCGKKIDQ